MISRDSIDNKICIIENGMSNEGWSIEVWWDGWIQIKPSQLSHINAYNAIRNTYLCSTGCKGCLVNGMQGWWIRLDLNVARLLYDCSASRPYLGYRRIRHTWPTDAGC